MLATMPERPSGTSQECCINPAIHHSWGIVCLHCGAYVPLQTSAGHSADADRPPERVSLVWCQVCLREAPYLPEEVVDMNEMPSIADLHVREAETTWLLV